MVSRNESNNPIDFEVIVLRLIQWNYRLHSAFDMRISSTLRTLRVCNNDDLEINLCLATIFEHLDWCEERQNIYVKIRHVT